ncbi:MAG: trypsin-like peptidase domain-containing protein [Eubacterium sp.]|nr:trypsin-like peptidase domain-containing protein [Eubacterium sp.]
MGYKTIVRAEYDGRTASYCLEKYNKDVISFGRSEECDIIIHNARTSRCHGCFYKEKDRWFVQDLDSRNGILVNNEGVKSRILSDGDSIILDREGNSEAPRFMIRVQNEISGLDANASKAGDNPHSETSTNGSDVALRKYDYSKRKTAIVIISIAAAVLILSLLGTVIVLKKKQADTTSGITRDGGDAEDGELSGEDIYNLASESTVEVTAVLSDTYSSLGTGFFDDTEGTVITNYHVIDGSKEAYITTTSGEKYDVVEVIGYDKNLDIAILSTNAVNTKPLAKRSELINTGEKVYALGSSQGYSNTFTEGIISSAEREERGKTYIQHTAPITNGNSGGPLLDSEGRVIGINTWGRVDGQNLNFAIPINMVSTVSRDVNLPLEGVYQTEYFAGDDTEVWTDGDLVKKTAAESEGRKLTFSIPSSFTESVNDGTLYYEKDDMAIGIKGEIKEGDYSDFSEESFENMIDEYIDDLSKKMKEEHGLDAEIEAESITINGSYWRVYTYSESVEGAWISCKMLFHYDDDTFADISIIAAYDEDDTKYEALELENGIVSSLSLEKK